MSEKRELKEARIEIKEMQEIRDRNRSENKDLENKNLQLQRMRVNMYNSLNQERLDLIARLERIDQRIEVLGFDSQREVKK